MASSDFLFPLSLQPLLDRGAHWLSFQTHPTTSTGYIESYPTINTYSLEVCMMRLLFRQKPWRLGSRWAVSPKRVAASHSNLMATPRFPANLAHLLCHLSSPDCPSYDHDEVSDYNRRKKGKEKGDKDGIKKSFP